MSGRRVDRTSILRATAAVGTAVLLLPALAACATSSSSSPGGGASSSSSAPSPTSTDPVVAVIGLTEAEAAAWATANGFTTRVVEVDGEPKPVTMDYRPDRINLTLVDGKVTKATLG